MYDDKLFGFYFDIHFVFQSIILRIYQSINEFDNSIFDYLSFIEFVIFSIEYSSNIFSDLSNFLSIHIKLVIQEFLSANRIIDFIFWRIDRILFQDLIENILSSIRIYRFYYLAARID